MRAADWRPADSELCHVGRGAIRTIQWSLAQARALWAAVLLVVVIVLAEIVGQLVFGLGRGVQYVLDDEIEYLPEPSREYRWLGHVTRYNDYSMRSDSFAPQRHSDDELRVVVFGDSIVNGGARVDQSELATELLKQRLNQLSGRRVVVGNVSAGSWGPPNLLAYVDRFGLFDADVVLIVTNNNDAWDVPAPLTERPTSADRPPAFAVQEVFQKLIARLQPADFDSRTPKSPENSAVVIDALRELARRARDSGAELAIVQHFGRSEMHNGPGEGTMLVRTALENSGISLYDTARWYRNTDVEEMDDLYADHTHLNAQGHRALAAALFDIVNELTVNRDAKPQHN